MVKTHQHGSSLQASHQIAEAIQFIQHIRALFKFLGFTFDQVQAIGFDQANVDFNFNHSAPRRLPVDGDVAGNILET